MPSFILLRHHETSLNSSFKIKGAQLIQLRKILAFVLVILIVAGSVGVALVLSKKPSLPPTAHAVQIVNATANVDAGAYLDYQFNIPSNSSRIHVSGDFNVQNRSSSGILVYIFDSTNFDNYSNGDYFGALYQSSQTTNGLISSNLDSNGTYYLVLDNTLSTINQTVNIQANATYSTP